MTRQSSPNRNQPTRSGKVSSWRKKFARANWSALPLDPKFELRYVKEYLRVQDALRRDIVRILGEQRCLKGIIDENYYVWAKTKDIALAKALHSQYGFQLKVTESTALLRARARDLWNQLRGESSTRLER